mgnify:CR=1 FL=1|tara:strand:+ start:949 stop:1722 length:774 start_codon:yes stop_codon:yes gene_type:complete
MKRRLFGICVAAISLAAQPALSAGMLDYRFGFNAYFGGFKVGEGNGELHWGDGRYAMDFKAQSAGALELLMKVDQTAFSNGRLDAKPQVERHRNQNFDGKKNNWIELAFTPETVDIVDAKPDPKTEKTRSPIPADMLRGVVDPMTAVLSLGLTATATDRCDATLPVFDGRRRYDAVFSQVGSEKYKGPAGVRDTLKCKFDFVRRAGYKKKDKRWKGLTGTVWLQTLGEGLPMLPVRVQVETSYGTALVHMVSARPMK